MLMQVWSLLLNHNTPELQAAAQVTPPSQQDITGWFSPRSDTVEQRTVWSSPARVHHLWRTGAPGPHGPFTSSSWQIFVGLWTSFLQNTCSLTCCILGSDKEPSHWLPGTITVWWERKVPPVWACSCNQRQQMDGLTGRGCSFSPSCFLFKLWLKSDSYYNRLLLGHSSLCLKTVFTHKRSNCWLNSTVLWTLFSLSTVPFWCTLGASGKNGSCELIFVCFCFFFYFRFLCLSFLDTCTGKKQKVKNLCFLLQWTCYFFLRGFWKRSEKRKVEFFNSQQLFT